jgi:hypothetical protein
VRTLNSSTWTARETSFSTLAAGSAHAHCRGRAQRFHPHAQTDDAVLLAHKSQAQKVKELVKRLSGIKLKSSFKGPWGFLSGRSEK